MDLLSWTFSCPPSDPDRPLLVDAADPSRSLSFTQLWTYSRRLVGGLRTILGIQAGDRICVLTYNDILYHVLYLGIIGSGARFTAVKPSYTRWELSNHLRMTQPKALIVEPPMLTIALASADECGIPRSMIFVFDIHRRTTRKDLQSWSVLLQQEESDFVPIPNPATTCAVYATTDGASGSPKAAMISHAHLVSQASLLCCGSSLPYRVCRLLALHPYHYFTALIVAASIHQGVPIFIMRRYRMTEFIECIYRSQITETYMTMAIISTILRSSVIRHDALQSLRQVWVSGVSISYSVQTSMYALLHPTARLNQVYGMAELGWATTAAWPERYTDGSAGRPLPGTQIRVVDSSGKPFNAEDQPGSVQIKTTYPMLGYLGRPGASVTCFTPSGWFRTGDIGYISEGKLFIIDRAQDLIKMQLPQPDHERRSRSRANKKKVASNGKGQDPTNTQLDNKPLPFIYRYVSPTQIEEALLKHPAISDAAVVGIPIYSPHYQAPSTVTSTSTTRPGTTTPGTITTSTTITGTGTTNTRVVTTNGSTKTPTPPETGGDGQPQPQPPVASGAPAEASQIPGAAVVTRQPLPRRVSSPHVLRAYVVTNHSAPIPLISSLRTYLSTMLPAYKVPTQILFIDNIPRNSAGKILRSSLRERDCREFTVVDPQRVAEKDLEAGLEVTEEKESLITRITLSVWNTLKSWCGWVGSSVSKMTRGCCCWAK